MVLFSPLSHTCGIMLCTLLFPPSLSLTHMWHYVVHSSLFSSLSLTHVALYCALFSFPLSLSHTHVALCCALFSFLLSLSHTCGIILCTLFFSPLSHMWHYVVHSSPPSLTHMWHYVVHSSLFSPLSNMWHYIVHFSVTVEIEFYIIFDKWMLLTLWSRQTRNMESLE